MRLLVNETSKLVSLFEGNPLSVPNIEAKKLYANHVDLASKEKAQFYNEMITVSQKESKERYDK